MEKQRVRTNAKSCRRLLIFTFALFINLPIFSQTLTASMINDLRIVPSENQNLYTKEDIQFEVTIPYVKSNQVQVQTPSLPANVTFKQVKKSEVSGGGIKLEIWFSFSKTGDYSLPDLSLVIQNRQRKIKFESVSIKNNPADMAPRIVVEFSNGNVLYSDMPCEPFDFPVGETINFTVNLQYAVQLIQFVYDIPKNSIFHQTDLYDIVEIKYREKKYSEELIPVASFEWTGLVTGPQVMPSLCMQVTGYNGYRIDVMMPEFSVNFVELEELEAENSDESVFDEAFDFAEDEENAGKKIRITEGVCEELAAIRKQERNSLINHKDIVLQRMEKEEKYMLPVTENEFFMGIYYLALLCVAVVILIIILLARKKRRNHLIFAFTMLICAFAFYIYAQVNMKKMYGIFKGGKVSSIPEENAESYSEISAGNRVQIVEKAGKWYYIELGETGGWCLTDEVLLIR